MIYPRYCHTCDILLIKDMEHINMGYIFRSLYDGSESFRAFFCLHCFTENMNSVVPAFTTKGDIDICAKCQINTLGQPGAALIRCLQEKILISQLSLCNKCYIKDINI